MRGQESRNPRDAARPSPRSLVWLVVPAVFAAHLATLSPTVGLIDSGELAAGCYLLNILHPTGYPLYTMLGRIVSLIPFGMVVNRVALLSAFLAAAGAGLFLWLLLRLGVSRTAAGVSTLLLALSLPVWSVAVDVEVYSLTLALLAVLWLACEQADRGRHLLLLGYLCGLAMTNHMSAASAVLGAGVCLVAGYRTSLLRPLPALGLALFAGASPYLFLVLRAQAGPLLAWGNPTSFERLWWHVTGKQYQVWMFSTPLPEVMQNAGRGLVLLAQCFFWVFAPVVVYGAVRLFRTRRNLALGLAVSAAAAFAYAVNYSIPDIEAYYIPCLLALAVFGAVGLDGVVRRLGRWRNVLWIAGILAAALNYRTAGRRGDYVAYDHAVHTISSARQNATIITDWWDVYSPVFYLQYVAGARPDICIIDKELLRRSWYFRYLERAYPWLVQRSRPEIDSYFAYLSQFEHGRLKDASGIQRCFIAMLESFVTRNPERPAYATYDADAGIDAQQMLPAYRRVPVGLLFELRNDTVISEFDYTQFQVRVPPHRIDMRTRATLEHYRYFVARRARELLSRGRTVEAEALAQWYLRQPVNRIAPLPAK